MSGASTEPCRGRRIPGPARCRQGQRTLSVGLTAFGRSSRAPAGYEPSTEAIMQVNSHIRLGRPASPKVGSWALSGCSSWTRLSTCLRCCSCSMWTRWSPSRLCWSCFGCPPCLFFDKFVDMPVAAQLQLVDKVVDFPACRSCCFSRCPS